MEQYLDVLTLQHVMAIHWDAWPVEPLLKSNPQKYLTEKIYPITHSCSFIVGLQFFLFFFGVRNSGMKESLHWTSCTYQETTSDASERGQTYRSCMDGRITGASPDVGAWKLARRLYCSHGCTVEALAKKKNAAPPWWEEAAKEKVIKRKW